MPSALAASYSPIYAGSTCRGLNGSEQKITRMGVPLSCHAANAPPHDCEKGAWSVSNLRQQRVGRQRQEVHEVLVRADAVEEPRRLFQMFRRVALLTLARAQRLHLLREDRAEQLRRHLAPVVEHAL